MRNSRLIAVSIVVLALVFAVKWQTTTAPAAVAKSRVTHWQYMTQEWLGTTLSIVQTVYTTTGTGEQRTPILSHAKSENQLETAWAKAIAKAGAEGWEMVNVIRGTATSDTVASDIYFKRPM